jgi:cation transport ATPase
MIFALLDSDFGIDGLVGLIIIQPVLGCIISVLTIVVCFIIGLPLHFNRRINRWQKKHFYLSIIMLFAGLLALLLSLFPSFAEEVEVMADGYEAVKNVPNRYLSLSGWFLTAFSILHLYPASFSFSKDINSRAGTVIRIAVTIAIAATSVVSIIAVLFCLIFLCHPDDKPFNYPDGRLFNQAERNRRDGDTFSAKDSLLIDSQLK